MPRQRGITPDIGCCWRTVHRAYSGELMGAAHLSRGILAALGQQLNSSGWIKVVTWLTLSPRCRIMYPTPQVFSSAKIELVCRLSKALWKMQGELQAFCNCPCSVPNPSLRAKDINVIIREIVGTDVLVITVNPLSAPKKK